MTSEPPVIRVLRDPVVWAALLLGLALRLWLSWLRPLLGDEVGTWIYMPNSYRMLFTSFIDPWLTMGPFIACVKLFAALFGESPFIMRLPVVAIGALGVPAVAGLVSRLGGGRTAVRLAALLVAVNPYLISFSANLRSYAIILAFAPLATLILVDWLREPSWRKGWWFGVCCAIQFLFHFSSVYFIAALGAVALVFCLVVPGRPFTRPAPAQLIQLILPGAVCFAPVAWNYYGMLDNMLFFKTRWAGEAPGSVNYLAEMAGSYFARGWLVLPSLAALLGGWIAAVRRSAPVALFTGTIVAVTLIMYAASGTQYYPWGSARLLIYLLPLFMTVIALGISWLGSRGAWLAAAMVMATWWPGLREPFRDAVASPWRDVHAYFARTLQADDVVVAPGHGHLHLLPGFRDLPGRLVYTTEYLKGADASSAKPQRLFWVTQYEPAPKGRPSTSFGSIAVTQYEGPDRRSIASNVVTDLLVRLDAPTTPDMAGSARTCLDFMEPLAWDAETRAAVQKKYFHALFRSRDGQFMPESARNFRFP